MMGMMAWSYPNFSIRAKSAAGTILYTWEPLTSPQVSRTVPVRIGPATCAEETLDRSLINGALRPYVRGYGVRLSVLWIVRSYRIDGASGIGYGTLEEVLERAVGGGYLELTLNGTTWRRVAIENQRQTNLDGKNLGIELEINFVQSELKTTYAHAGVNSW